MHSTAAPEAYAHNIQSQPSVTPHPTPSDKTILITTSISCHLTDLRGLPHKHDRFRASARKFIGRAALVAIIITAKLTGSRALLHPRSPKAGKRYGIHSTASGSSSTYTPNSRNGKSPPMQSTLQVKGYPTAHHLATLAPLLPVLRAAIPPA